MNDILDFFLQHWQLSILFIAVIAAYLVYELMFGEDKETIGADQAIALMNHEHGVVVDVRTPAEYSTGHILHSINLDSTEFAAKSKKLNKYMHKPVILVCARGRRSAQCLTTLKEQGFARVYSLAGGMEAWKAAGLPLVQ